MGSISPLSRNRRRRNTSRRPRPDTGRFRCEALEERALLSASFQEFPAPPDAAFPAQIVSTPTELQFANQSGTIGVASTSGAISSTSVPFGHVDNAPVHTPTGTWLSVSTTSISGTTTTTSHFLDFEPNSGGSVVTIKTGVTTVTKVPGSAPVTHTIGDAAGALALGPDGNLWFTEPNANAIGRAEANGNLTIFPFHTFPKGLVDITAGPDGNLWFTEQIGNAIGKITTSGEVTEYGFPKPDSGPAGITLGPDGNLWFTEQTANRVGRITPAGKFLEYDLPTPGNGADSITTGPDGNLYVTEPRSNQIAQVIPSGVIREFVIPTPKAGAHDLTTGPDGNIWFTETDANQIGKLDVASINGMFGTLAPGSDSGVSNRDGVTNVTRPTFEGMTVPGSEVSLAAVRYHDARNTFRPFVLARTTADPVTGHWSATVDKPLHPGPYVITAWVTEPSGQTRTGVLQIGESNRLVIDTRGPSMLGALLKARTGHLYVSFADDLSGLAFASVVNPIHYTLTDLSRTRPTPLRVTSAQDITSLSSFSTSITNTVDLTVNDGQPLPNGKIELVADRIAITDVAGNPILGIPRRRLVSNGQNPLTFPLFFSGA